MTIGGTMSVVGAEDIIIDRLADMVAG